MKRAKRILSLCLALVMTMALFPAGLLTHAAAANGSVKMTTGQELFIFLAKDMTYRWNINGSGGGHNAVCHLDYNSGENCRFVLGNEKSDGGDTWYSIKYTGSKYYLDVEGNNRDDNKVLHQNSTDPNQNNRRFCFIPVPGKANTYYIKAKHSGSYVSLQNGDGSPSKHQKVAQRKNDATEWYIVPAKNQSSPSDKVTDYLQKGDYIAILPAEKDYKNGSSSPLAYTTYALSGQDDNTANGNDVQMYEIGTTKWVVMRESDGRYQIGYSNLRETTPDHTDWDARYWDIENVSVNPGTNVHLWEDDDLNDDNKLFFLQDDHDGDPETFYICNDLAWKHWGAPYLAPRGYYSGGTPEKDGVNTELSFHKFRWRVQVIDREVTGVDAAWMDKLPDGVRLSNVNIPGTHDSCTANAFKLGVQGANNVICQRYFIDEQLIAGVRALDLRYDEKNGEIVMCHGDMHAYNKDHNTDASPAGDNLRLRQVLQTVKDFLALHPRETVILVLKQDSGPDSAPANMVKVVKEFADCCYDWSNSAPTLGEVRGKMVLMTRTNVYNLGLSEAETRMFGPNLSKWDSNYKDNHHFAQPVEEPATVGGKTLEMPRVFVQDDYNSSDGQKKQWVKNVLQQMNEGLPGKVDDYEPEDISEADFVFNYTSKTYGDDILNPLFASRTMNHYLIYDGTMQKYFGGGMRTGITMMDYADKSLAHYIIHSNSNRTADSVQIAAIGGSAAPAKLQVETLLPEDCQLPEEVSEKLHIEQEGNENLAEVTEPDDPVDVPDESDPAEPDEAQSVSFDDCAEDDWYYDSVTEAAEEGYMNGGGDGKFYPDGTMDRSMLIQILHNLAGRPEAADGGFPDIKGSEWYAKAASWAREQGLVVDGKFVPGRLVSREEIAMMLYSFARNKGYDVTGTTDLSGFDDSDEVSEDAQTAMAWAVANGVMEGTDANELAPGENITRAEMAQILVNFVKGFMK